MVARQPDNNAVLNQVYDALNRHDPAGVAALATDDVTVYDAAQDRVVTGRKAVEEHYRSFFQAFPDVHYSSTNRLHQGDTIVDEWVVRGTHKGELHVGKLVLQPTNQSFELHGVSIFDFSGGLVRRQRLYYDTLSFASQLGLTELLQARAAGL